MLPKKNRLDLSQNRRRIIGEKVSNEDLSLTVNNTGTLKAAVIVSKKVAPLAVDRNRIKRQVSAALQGQNIILGDILVVVKKNISKSNTKSVAEKIERLLLELKNV